MKIRQDFDKDKLFFTSDTHFFHNNIIKYCDSVNINNRRFKQENLKFWIQFRVLTNCILFDNFAQIFWDNFIKFLKFQEESILIFSSRNSFILSAEKKHFIQICCECKENEATDSWQSSQRVRSLRKRRNVSKNCTAILMKKIV